MAWLKEGRGIYLTFGAKCVCLLQKPSLACFSLTPVGAHFLMLRIHTPEIHILLAYFDSYYLKFLIYPGLIILLISLSSSSLVSLKNSCISLLFRMGNTNHLPWGMSRNAK